MQYVSSEKRLVLLFFAVILCVFSFLAFCALLVISFFNEEVVSLTLIAFAAVFIFVLLFAVHLNFTTFRFFLDQDKIVLRDVFCFWETALDIDLADFILIKKNRVLRIRSKDRYWNIVLNEEKTEFFKSIFPNLF